MTLSLDDGGPSGSLSGVATEFPALLRLQRHLQLTPHRLIDEPPLPHLLGGLGMVVVHTGRVTTISTGSAMHGGTAGVGDSQTPSLKMLLVKDRMRSTSGTPIVDDKRQTNPAAWSALQAKLSKWASLPNDWDGDDGIAPSTIAVANARLFLDAAAACGAPVPMPYIAGDGEVGFRWKKGDGYASAAFLSNGTILLFARKPDETATFADKQTVLAESDFSELFIRLPAFA